MTNFKDYDALNAEREDFVRRIGGEDIEFRKVLPAKTVLDIRRKANKNMSDEDEEEFAFALVEQIVGQEKYDHIANHLSTQQLMELFGEAMVYYGLAEEDVQGKAEVPTEKEAKPEPLSPSSESSGGGEPLTLTSSGSTLTPEEPFTMEPSTGSPSPLALVNSPRSHTS